MNPSPFLTNLRLQILPVPLLATTLLALTATLSACSGASPSPARSCSGNDCDLDAPPAATHPVTSSLDATAGEPADLQTADAAACTAPTSLLCNGSCVDPTSPAHCGSCANACPEPDSGTGSAVCTLDADGGGACSVTCSGTTTQLCGSLCYAPNDVNHCGSCNTACAAPANAAPTCTGTPPTCGFNCAAGYHLCGSGCDPNTDEPSNTVRPA